MWKADLKTASTVFGVATVVGGGLLAFVAFLLGLQTEVAAASKQRTKLQQVDMEHSLKILGIGRTVDKTARDVQQIKCILLAEDVDAKARCALE